MKNKLRLNYIQVILFVLLLISIQACNKDDVNNNPSGGGGGSAIISYSFSNPVNILRLGSDNIIPSAAVSTEISSNYINFLSLGDSVLIYLKAPIGQTNSISNNGTRTNLSTTNLISPILPSLGGSIDKTGLPNFNFLANPLSNFFWYFNYYQTVGLFTIDKNETNIYAFVPIKSNLNNGNKWKQILKWNLSTNQVSKLLPDNSNQLNFLNSFAPICIRIDGTDVYIASMANNGCVVKITGSGNVILMASNLINPGFFQVYNSNLYVPINSASNGKIIKIDQNKTVTDVITNLTGPTNVAIDNYGNLVVRSLTTIGGGNYHRYDLYKMDGNIIGNVKDASGNSILSNTNENMPMTFDSYNNLYFFHADGVVNGGLTYNNPTGQKGLFKLG
ncbi:MAG: hypothetical protein IPP81_21975 [Chitinophagaceae bacterium]|nr:hypothetical protein [Chitinophagaceae bacterium]